MKDPLVGTFAGGATGRRSHLQLMIAMERMLQRRFANVVTCLRHRITNATSESLSDKFQWVKYTTHGLATNRTSSTPSG